MDAGRWGFENFPGIGEADEQFGTKRAALGKRESKQIPTGRELCFVKEWGEGKLFFLDVNQHF